MRIPRTRLQILVSVCALVATIAACDVHAQDLPHDPTTPEQAMYKGRLAAVEFALKMEPKRRVIALVFLVDADWAMGPYDHETGPRMAKVVTDWPVGDLSGISSANYVETINSMLRNGVRLGEAYIVTSHHPGAYGPELLTIEPATQANEARFLAENHGYIRNSRWYYERSALRSKLMRLGVVQHEIQRLAADRMSMAADARAATTLDGLIESKLAAGETERENLIHDVANTILSLNEELAGTTDAVEQQYVAYRIKDAERTLADLKAFTFSATP